MGVDRLQSAPIQIFGGDAASFKGFKDADKLWAAMQNKTVINVNGWQGSATTYPPAILRPKWNTVAEFLKGKITLQQLKTALNCP